ncbi:MAG: outer membrane protein, partial [Rhodospirillales bacterium]
MVRGVVIGGMVLALSALGPFKANAAEKNWYFNFSGGTNILQDADNDGNNFSVESSFNRGATVLGAIGKKHRQWRLEGELSYRYNTLDTIDSVSVGGTGAATGLGLDADGDIHKFGLMVNAIFDFDLNSKWSPFILAGFGTSYINASDISIAGTRVADDSDFVFAYQGGVGLNYNSSESWSAGLQYRLFGTSDPKFDAVD